MIGNDLSDAAMAQRWGHVLNEIPELWDALRKFEIENRPMCKSGGFRIKSDAVSVQRRHGGVLRIEITRTRR